MILDEKESSWLYQHDSSYVSLVEVDAFDAFLYGII